MKRSLVLLFLCAMVALSSLAQSIQGEWVGALYVQGYKLNIVFNIDGDKCTMDSPDQGAKGIPAQLIFNANDSIAIAVPNLGVLYTAKRVGEALKGRFKQNGMTFDLDLTSAPFVRNRPQTPKSPFPYTEQELSFVNPHDSACLVGSLTMPLGVAQPMIVVMVSGSGQQNRDEEIFEHKPFYILADAFARAGIASFRYDDRGVGKSGGLRADLTTNDFKNDARAAAEMLRQRGEFSKIGILGHSEGGLIAFMIAGESPRDVDFIISLAGTAVSGDSILYQQIRALTEASGQTISDAEIKANIAQSSSANAWYNYFITYDPTEAIRQIECPLFAANGTRDLQVLADKNMAALKNNFKAKPNDRFVVYEGLNHLFQHCEVGLPVEYAQIEETFAEQVIADIIEWFKLIEK